MLGLSCAWNRLSSSFEVKTISNGVSMLNVRCWCLEA